MTGAIAATAYAPPSNPPASVQLHNQSLTALKVRGMASATYVINSSGNVQSTLSPGGTTTLEAWLTGGGSSSSYQVMATQTSGSTISGTLGSWLSCGSSNSWNVSNASGNNSVLMGVMTVQIRDVATQTVQASASITLSAESDSF